MNFLGERRKLCKDARFKQNCILHNFIVFVNLFKICSGHILNENMTTIISLIKLLKVYMMKVKQELSRYSLRIIASRYMLVLFA